MSKQVNMDMETFTSATYLENYLVDLENFPNEYQGLISRIRELEVSYMASVREVHNQQQNIRECRNRAKKEKMFKRMEKALIAARELGYEKIDLLQIIIDKVELKKLALEEDFRHLAESLSNGRDVDTAPVETSQNKPVTPEHSLRKRQTPVFASSAATGSNQKKTSTAESLSNGRDVDTAPVETSQNKPVTPEHSLRKRQTPVLASSAATGSNQKKTSTDQKKIRKSRQNHQTQKEDSPPPEEPSSDSDATHCLCDKTSLEEMIMCDNDHCPIEWFHFSCVSLTAKPKGNWFCPKCRGGRPNVMKRKARFL